MADFGFWRDALAGKDMSKRTHADSPELGFYRTRSKNKSTGAISWQPVAYFQQDNKIACQVGSNAVSELRGQELWSYSCRYPVSEAAWRGVVERGENWPDMDAIVADQTRGPGDNSSGVSEEDQLIEQAKNAAEGKKDYLKVETEEKSQQAQSLRSRLLELVRQVKAIHKKQKDPHWERCKEIDTKWLTLAKELEAAAGSVKKANDDYLTGLLQARRRAEQQAAEEVAQSDMMEEPEPEIAAPAVPQQVRGAYGRAAAVKTVWVVKEITDYDALYQFLKGSAAVKEALEGLAKKAVLDGEVPGVLREEVARS